MDLARVERATCPRGHLGTVEVLRIEVTSGVFTEMRGQAICLTCLTQMETHADDHG